MATKVFLGSEKTTQQGYPQQKQFKHFLTIKKVSNYYKKSGIYFFEEPN
jgi:hypothetical protein